MYVCIKHLNISNTSCMLGEEFEKLNACCLNFLWVEGHFFLPLLISVPSIWTTEVRDSVSFSPQARSAFPIHQYYFCPKIREGSPNTSQCTPIFCIIALGSPGCSVHLPQVGNLLSAIGCLDIYHIIRGPYKINSVNISLLQIH